jgi:thiamine biosynthesis lipoprotein
MLNRLEFYAMGCEVLAVVEAESQPTLLSKIPEWFEEWEQSLSRFRQNSELTRFNQTHEKPVRVSQTFWEVFHAACKAEQMTDGLVTATLLDALISAGYDRPFDLLSPQTMSIAAPHLQATSTLAAIRTNESTREITLPHGMSLDFGGVAKGWAAYQAMQRLQIEGPTLIDAAGDIAISGPRVDGSPWTVGIANPFNANDDIEVISIHKGGVATSGKDRRRWLRNGIPQHHIIDPSTNQPAETDVLTVTVIAPDVMQAEAAAKAAFILGSRLGLEWLESQNDLSGLFVLENGRTIYSKRMNKYL